ncbi:Bor/Iss family lipoprotein [Aeromonas allosaccharophila]|uniref:Bor/Iss family lipoprotein n=1 Tax=Aeromonas allosaccharophila TaxID=656 RepID=UPI003D2447BE
MVNYKAIIIVCLTVVNCGCAKQVVDVNAAQAFTLGNENSVSSTEVTSHFFFSDIDIGLNEPIDAAAICHGAENIVRIETKQSWLDSLASGITYGIYTPREARIYCSKKS